MYLFQFVYQDQSYHHNRDVHVSGCTCCLLINTWTIKNINLEPKIKIVMRPGSFTGHVMSTNTDKTV